MSVETNVAIARTLLDYLAQGREPDAVASLCAENLIYEVQGDDGLLPWIGRKQGRRAMADFVRDLREMTEPLAFDVEDVLASQSRAAIVGSLRTRIKATDKIAATQFAIILTIADGKVQRFQMLEDSFDVANAARQRGD